MARTPERNDRRPASGRGLERPWKGGARPQRATTTPDWLWGVHAVEAALRNPARAAIQRVLATPERARAAEALRPSVNLEIADGSEIGRRLPPGAVHQGLALQTPELEGIGLDELAEPASGLLVLLDQVTDPQNIGAVFRSAAAFGARGLILQDRRAPPLAGALAKAAAGSIEQVPCARVVNLARALDQLADAGWRAVGLEGSAETTLEEAFEDDTPTVLVLGSEGEGLRRLVGEHCDVLAKIPMPGGFESLNVSIAAAIALYEASRGSKMRAGREGG